MEQSFGTKGLYSVVLKTTYNIEDLGVEEGEVVASFDDIQIGGLDELRRIVTARGGYGNPGWVTWDITKELNLNFSQGTFSKKQLQILLNSKNGKIENEEGLTITKEEKPSVVNGKINLTEQPVKKVFIYFEDGSKQVDISKQKEIEVNKKVELVRYEYIYSKPSEIISVGDRLIKGYLSLEGRMRLKDDETGHTITGIIKIPKLKLMSGLSMRLGRNSIPFVADFTAVAYPVGGRGAQKVCDFYILPDDIDNNDIMIESLR